MRINLTTGEFTEVTITSGTLQNISPQAPVEVASTATKNTGIILPPYATLSYSDNATVYARNAWDDDSTCVIAVEPFKKAGEGGEYTLPIATSSKLGGVKVGSNLSIDESGVLSAENNYSTEEQRIGTWIDGKPIYQKTYSGTLAGTELSTIDSSLGEIIDWIVDGSTTVNLISGSSNYIIPNGFYDATHYITKPFKTNENKIVIKTADGYNSLPYIATLQYTKTTDQNRKERK
jgi:hypothetical protein